MELLSSEQNECLCNFLNTRFESHLRLVSAIWGDPRTRYSMAPYSWHPEAAVAEQVGISRDSPLENHIYFEKN